MVQLREGWNYTVDVSQILESHARSLFNLSDAEKLSKTIFESAAISMGNFIIVAVLILRKTSNYQVDQEINNFEANNKSLIGMRLIQIGEEKCQEIMEEFEQLYSKYDSSYI